MPLPLSADSLDAIPEPVRAAYVEKGGKFVLDADIKDPSEGLVAKNTELINKNKQLAARAAILGERTPEEVQADLELAAKFKEDRAKAAGDFEELKKIQAAELAKANERIAQLQSGRQNDAKKREAMEAIASAGGKVKKLLDPVMKHLKPVEEDGEIVIRVVDAKGNVRIMDGQGTPMTTAQLVEEMKADEDYGNDFAAPAASGSGARNDGGQRGGSLVTISKEDARDTQKYRRARADAEKRGVALQIVG